MNGDEVRDARFPDGFAFDYDVSQVDDLLRRIAVELDAGQPAGPLIATATFRQASGLRSREYDIDAVDWFLDPLARQEDHPELATVSADLWRGLAAA